jgi:hypothetical protein
MGGSKLMWEYAVVSTGAELDDKTGKLTQNATLYLPDRTSCTFKVSSFEDIVYMLNQLARDGWELVNVTDKEMENEIGRMNITYTAMHFFLKREIR